MLHADIEFKPASRVICAVPVLPAYQHHPEYVGILQWCDGPDVEPIPGEAPSIAFHIQKKAGNHKGPTFYFRALKHTLSLLDCTKKNGDAAILQAFTALCRNEKVMMTIGEPFASDLTDPDTRQAIVDFITEHFNYLHENNQQ